VDGEVVEANSGLADDQSPLATDPFGEGWLLKIRMAGKPVGLLDLAAYEKQLATEQAGH
jgi:glycine cleavage system H protein